MIPQSRVGSAVLILGNLEHAAIRSLWDLGAPRPPWGGLLTGIYSP
jgi:hypothetical protein